MLCNYLAAFLLCQCATSNEGISGGCCLACFSDRSPSSSASFFFRRNAKDNNRCSYSVPAMQRATVFSMSSDRFCSGRWRLTYVRVAEIASRWTLTPIAGGGKRRQRTTPVRRRTDGRNNVGACELSRSSRR